MVVCFEPADRLLQPVAQRGVAVDPELFHPCDVKTFHQLAFGLRRIPSNVTRVPGQLLNRLGQLANRGACAGGNIDRLTGIVTLDEERDGTGHVGNIDEIAYRRAASPANHFFYSLALGFDKAPNHGRNHMRLVLPKVVVLAVDITRNHHG